MLVGIDFDNTLVCYDALFARAAAVRGLLLPGAAASKQEIRDELRRTGREPLWTELQGYVYGKLIRQAPAFPGVHEFFAAARRRGTKVCVVSHKTRRPYLGAPYDLRQAAHDWLHSARLPVSAVHFEDAKVDKLRRIAAVGCTHFIDDLPEFLAEPEFPAGVERILFDPGAREPQPPFHFAGGWRAIADYLFPEEAA
jgi:hypothetical protein